METEEQTKKDVGTIAIDLAELYLAMHNTQAVEQIQKVGGYSESEMATLFWVLRGIQERKTERMVRDGELSVCCNCENAVLDLSEDGEHCQDCYEQAASCDRCGEPSVNGGLCHRCNQEFDEAMTKDD